MDILISHRQPDISRMLQLFVKHPDINVTDIPEHEKALASVVAGSRPDMLIINEGMDPPFGHQIAAQIKEISPTTKTVVVSGKDLSHLEMLPTESRPTWTLMLPPREVSKIGPALLRLIGISA